VLLFLIARVSVVVSLRRVPNLVLLPSIHSEKFIMERSLTRAAPRTATAAASFHVLADSVLSREGFVLLNDTNKILGRFGESVCIYSSESGLYLSVGFDPGDTNTIQLSLGRGWFVGPELYGISNNCSILAERLGVQMPLAYPLGYGEDQRRGMDMVVKELDKKLPVLIEKVTLEDLDAVERHQFGVRTRAAELFGPIYSACVEIQECRVRANSG
jgi:hypothetical protein